MAGDWPWRASFGRRGAECGRAGAARTLAVGDDGMLPAARPRVPPAAALHKRAAASATAAVAAALLAASPALAAAPTSALSADVAATFQRTCAGCHAGGGNVVVAGATLFPDALSRAGLDTPDAMERIIALGRGRMPGYGAACAPAGACTFGARLGEGTIRELAAFVLQRAAEGWK